MGKTVALNIEIAELQVNEHHRLTKLIKVADSDKLKNDIKQIYTELLTEQIANGTIEVYDNYGQKLSISKVLQKLKWVSWKYYVKNTNTFCEDRAGQWVQICRLMASTLGLTDKPEALILSKVRIKNNRNK